jgi:hypothetical protein
VHSVHQTAESRAGPDWMSLQSFSYINEFFVMMHQILTLTVDLE